MSCLVRRGFIRPFGRVLGLAGMEWTFFIAAHKVLCFGWGARAGMMPHQGFGCCQTVLAQHQGSVSHSALLSLRTFREQAGGGGTRGLEGTQPEHSTQTDRWIFHTRWCHALQGKLSEKGEEKGCSSFLVDMLKLHFPGSGETSSCQWETLN